MYVDDIILTGSHSSEIQHLKQHLNEVFSIKDLGGLHYFLGIEVNKVSQGIVLTQKNFTNDLLVESGITLFRHVVTPLPVNLKLQGSDGAYFSNPSLYRSLVGKLNFLTHTRPDLSYTLQTLSQFMQTPREQHFEALKHTLCYVYHTAGQGILLQGSDHLTLDAFSDSDWAACSDTRRSVTGYCFSLVILLLAGNPRSKVLFHVPALSPNIEQWPQPLLK